jgi:hypothetical protein
MKITQRHTITKSQVLTLFREVKAVSAESHTQIINTLCKIIYKFPMLMQVASHVFIRSINYISGGINRQPPLVEASR